jgi:hypothetical protein
MQFPPAVCERMTAILLTLTLFAAWWLIGLAVLVVVRADLRSPRVALTAPVLGTAATLIPLFVLSHAGVPMEDGAPPVAVALLVCSVAVVARRRPGLPMTVLPVIAIAVGALFLVGWPMLGFGFHWIANANDDMANYVLSATDLLHRGLLASVDLGGLSRSEDYPSLMSAVHAFGARPGADITLAGFAGITGMPANEVFMTLILALYLCTICGTAALALQATQRWWAAAAAAALVAVSPLTTYGVLQQLLPQVWGLGLAAALCALLMRRELYRGSRIGVADVVPISMLVATLVVVYVELASTVVLAYALYLALLTSRREFDPRAAARLWLPILAVTVAVVNRYLIREFHFVRSQTGLGVHGLFSGPPTFGFTLVPSALPGIVGLQNLPAQSNAHLLEWSIAAAAILLAAAVAVSVRGAIRGAATSVVLLTYAALGIFLGVESSDFGLFKLYMYLQPFLAAGVAVWLAGLNSKRVLAFAGVSLLLLAGFQLSTQQGYVRASRVPLGLPNASSLGLLPTFGRLTDESRNAIITVTENPTLGKLEAVRVGQRPMYFISQNLFAPLMSAQYLRLNGWKKRSFNVLDGGAPRADAFSDNARASAILSRGQCTIILPTGTQTVLNRRSLPEGDSNLVAIPCSARNTLVFTASKLGQGYFAFSDRSKVSLYPVEPDFYTGQTMSAFGRYALFRILRPSPNVRLELNLTTTYIHNGSNLLSHAAVVGKSRVPLPLVGRGSARVFSAPLRSQIIGGQAFALLDMGSDGMLQPESRPGLEGIYGRSVPIDPRFVTSHVRDVSLVSNWQYDRLRRPSVLSAFPKALANPNLEYSGIYEDGWVAEDSYAVLAAGKAADLLIRADVRPASGGQQLRVLVNGRQLVARSVAPGHLDLRLAVPASRSPRRVELRWSSVAPLPAPDGRPTAALLRLLGVVPHGSVGTQSPPVVLQHFPSDLSNPNVSYSGIYGDGWLHRQAFVTLMGGKAADLLLRAEVPAVAGGQTLQVQVNGRQITSRHVAPGHLELRIAMPPSEGPRRVDLRWTSAPRLPAPDGRPASALLKFLGILPRAPR